jgi:cell division protein FtsW (lipid II flippase)
VFRAAVQVQQVELARRRAELDVSQRWFQHVFFSLFGLGIGAVVIGLAYLGVLLTLASHEEHSKWPAVIGVALGVGLLSLCPMTGERLAWVKEWIQNIEFEDDLLRFAPIARENLAAKLLRIQESQIRRYYELNLGQNSWTFAVGAMCIPVGADIAAYTLHLPTLPRANLAKEET